MKKRKKRKPDKLKEGGILQFSLEGKFIREYSSVREATKVLKIGYVSIHYCLTGRRKTGGKFQWRYKIDPNFDEGIFDIPPVITKYSYNLHPIVQYTLEGKFVKEYSSIKEAAEIFAVPPTLIKKCTKGEKKSTKGYQWRLKKDVIKDGKIIDIEPASKPLGVAVCKFDMDGKFIREYPSMSEAAGDEGVSIEAISSRLERKKCKDYQWRLKKEVEKDGKIIDIAPYKKTMYRYSYPVCQFGKNGTFIREYPSVIDAAEKTNIDKYYIFYCAAKKSKSTSGFQWRFKKELVKKDGKITDIEPVMKIRYKHKIKPKYLYPVCQYGLDGTFIREYPSIIEAAEKTNIARYFIFSCAAKKLLKSTGGFQWRFKKEVVKKDGKITDIETVRSMSPLYFRAVCQFKMGGKFIREYPSIIEAAEKTNITKSGILACVVKKNKSSGGFKWRLTEEVVKKKKDRKKKAIKLVKGDPSNYLRAVCQFKQDGTLVREYSSIYEASKKTNTTRSLILLWASKKMKKRDGYLWRFKEDVVDKDGKILDIDTSKPVPYRYRRAVCQFGRDGKFLREYSSMIEAGKDLRIDHKAIYRCLNSIQKTAGDFQWQFKKEVVKKDGKITDIEPVMKIRSKHKIKPKYLYPVCQYGLDGTFIREYPSVIEAAEKTNIDKYSIFHCAAKKNKSTGGFQWQFKEEVVMKDGRIPDIEPAKKRSPFYFHAVCQFERSGKFIREYPSIIEAAEKTNIKKFGILARAVRQAKSAGGFLWRFTKDVKEKDGTIKDIEIKRPGANVHRYLRAVCQFEKNGKFIREYPSIKDAAKKNEAYEESIYRCTQKKQKTTAGFQWRLKEEVVKKDGKIKDIEPDRPVLPHFLRAVCQFKQYGTFVREYPSIYEASKKTNITRGVIFTSAGRKAKSRDGYLWRFKEDVVDKDGKISDIDIRELIPGRFLRPVCQFGRDGKFLREYPSILDAAQKTSIYKEYISLCAQRKIKITTGFQWRYKDDPEFKNGITDIAPYERKESWRRKKKKE